MAEEKISSTATSSSLPPVGQLFKESWNVLKKNILHLFIFSIIGIAGFIGITIVAGLILLFAGLGSILPSLMSHGTPHFSTFFIAVTAITALAWIIALVILGSIVGIGPVLIISSDKELPYGEVLKRSYSLVGSYYWVALLSGFIILGGLFVFIIPALLFSFFFIFSTYEVVLGGKRGMGALKSSYNLVRSNFWGIFGRWALLIGLTIVVSMLSQSLFGASAYSREAGFQGGTFALSYIVNTLVSWFSLCYGVRLYAHATTARKEEKSASFTWVWIVSLLGYVILIFMGVGVASLISRVATDKNLQSELQKSLNSPEMKKLQEKNQMKYNYEDNSQYYDEGALPTYPPLPTYEAPQRGAPVTIPPANTTL